MRVRGSSASRNKLKKLYSITKGFYGRKKNVYRRAREAYLHALTSAFAGRKLKKRDFRKLWIVRINAAARANGISYSALMNGLKQAGIVMNRKMLADLAINDAAAFAKLVQLAKDPAKKPAAKKASAKPSAKAAEKPAEEKIEAPAEKPAAKKPAAKKTTAKTAEKSADKPAAKKPAAKKTTAKADKPAEKKPAAKKTTKKTEE